VQGGCHGLRYQTSGWIFPTDWFLLLWLRLF